jgi:outer membrane protein
MKFKILSLFIIIFLFLTVVGRSQQSAKDSLSLQDAINLTLQNQPLIEQALEQVNAADAKIKQQDSYYYPKINGYLSYARIGPTPSIDFGGNNFELAPANNYNAHITAYQLVYDFGQRDAEVDLYKSYKISSLDKLILIKNNLTYQTVQLFYAILFLRKSVDVKDEQINNLNRHLEVTTKKYESGSATDFDILTTKVRIADAENQKIEIVNELNKYEIKLRTVLNLPSDYQLNLTGKFTVDSLNTDSATLLNTAFQNRPEMKLARDAEQSSIVSKQVASFTNIPTLSVLADYGLTNGYQPNIDVLRGNWVFGINATIPIFYGNLKDAKVEEAEANIKSSSANIQSVERDVKVDVEQAFQDLKANKLKIGTTEVQVEQAVEAVSRAELQYQYGVITNLDIIDSETSLAQARLLYLQSQYKYIISNYQLKKAIGETLF